MLRIGIFSDSINIPPKEGINVHTYDVACGIANRDDCKVVLIVCDRGWLDLEIMPRQPFDTIVLPPEDFYDRQKIEKLFTQLSLDVLQTYMVYFAATVLGPASATTNVPMCVEFHDIESQVVPLYSSYKKEIEFHYHLQQRAGNLASIIRIMSRYDFDCAGKKWPELIPNMEWMPVALRRPDRNNRHSAAHSIIFVGNTSYPPNQQAAEYIAGSLAPSLPPLKFALVGRGTERFSGPNLTGFGMVTNLQERLSASVLGLAPIFEGSGMKIKVLDYLAAGLPVLTTSLGAHGYPISDAIVIENDMSSWPKLVSKLLSDGSELKRLSKVARELFESDFVIDNSIDKLVRIYERLTYKAIGTEDSLTDIKPNQRDIYWLREIRETPRETLSEIKVFKGNG